MCGIAGFTHLDRRVDSSVLRNALESIRHRGPDAQGCHTAAHASLGATRLRIVDLAAGDQPMRSADGNLTLVFNGEIYNHAALRRELEQQGCSFSTHCDTEVLLHAFARWGVGCLGRMRGMFALALWDEREQRLVLARDPMGIKPLYYHQRGRDLSFGSELKCIFADPAVDRVLDLEALNCYLSLNYVPGPFTLVEGIRKLMPGCVLDWRNGQFAISEFSTNSDEAAPQPPATLPEAQAKLDRLLHAAVGEQLASDVPLGIWLSGGLDSSTVLHYAAEHATKRLKTFSITFHGQSFDESRYIHKVAAAYGTEHTEFDLGPEAGLEALIHDLAYYSDEPSADAGAVPVWFLARLSQPFVTTVLGGEGADELFGGYLTYRADRLHQQLSNLPGFARRSLAALTRMIPASNQKIGLDYKLRRLMEGSLLSAEEAHVYWNGTFSEAEKQQIYRYADREPMRALLELAHGRDFGSSTESCSSAAPNAGSGSGSNSLERFLRFDQRVSLVDGILYKVDRMSMAHSVEVRPPFLDPRIVAFARSLPMDYKLKGSQSKIVLRELMRNKLPGSVLSRPKVGFDIPIHAWFRGPLRSLLTATINEQSICASGLFNWPAVEQLLNDHQARRANYGYHLWGLMTLLLWMKRWQIRVPDSAYGQQWSSAVSPAGPGPFAAKTTSYAACVREA